MSLARDLSVSAVTAGFVTVLVGFASSAVIVYLVARRLAPRYAVPISPLMGWTGVANLALAPFGAFALNLAAITAAICMGREGHEDPRRRYVAAIAAGCFYMVVGLFGATVVGLFAAFAPELIAALAGLPSSPPSAMGGPRRSATRINASRRSSRS